MTHTFVNIKGTHPVTLWEPMADYGDHYTVDVVLDDAVVTVMSSMVIPNEEIRVAWCDQCDAIGPCVDMKQYGDMCLPCYRLGVLAMEEA